MKKLKEKIELIRFGLLEDGYQEINTLVELCDEALELLEEGQSS